LPDGTLKERLVLNLQRATSQGLSYKHVSRNVLIGQQCYCGPDFVMTSGVNREKRCLLGFLGEMPRSFWAKWFRIRVRAWTQTGVTRYVIIHRQKDSSPIF